ncbi:MAG: HAMP domain-containing protein [Spirochaetales bacterium]|nr:HAMP domain-containing protein [Spirochaetales bacterium]
MQPADPTWRKQELQIYVRDVLFFALITLASVVGGELALAGKEPLLADRITVYLLIFVPLGTLNLLAHYIYRNRRIRKTGSLRTSLRYRLSLAFLLVAIVPGLPLFLLVSHLLTAATARPPVSGPDLEELLLQLRLFISLGYMIIIGLCFVAATFLARSISHPIVTLAEATHEIARGHFTPVALRAEGELGILINRFNQMTSELGSLRRRLLQRERQTAWQEVARRLAHEIQNPLTPIKLNAERLLRRVESGRASREQLENMIRHSSRTIIDQVDIMKALVREFVDFARLPQARPQRQPVGSIMEESLRLFEAIPDLKLELNLDRAPQTAAVDRNILLGIIHNLVQNALQSISESGVRAGHIRLTLDRMREHQQEFLKITIEDNGPGVEAALQERIFEPYFTTREGGTGLGLAMVEKGVIEHQGRIRVAESADLGGALFEILLPQTNL